ncbi:hypothetical protein D3C86_1834290 [compost metagenome]
MGPTAMATIASCLGMDTAQPALCMDHQQESRHWADSNGHSRDFSALPVVGGPLHIVPPTPYMVWTFHTVDSANNSPAPVYLATARLRI